ncbi:MAG: DUF1616 domain-containing protein, partial [Promethearchaeota archaeon]
MDFSYLKNFFILNAITTGFAAIVIVDSMLSGSILIITILRSVFGLIFLFGVGYSLTAILFPEGEIDSIERFALSIVLSASIALLTAMILGLTPVGLSLLSAMVFLSLLTLCFTLIKIFQHGGKKITPTNASVKKIDYLIMMLLIISSILIPLRNVLGVEFFYAYDPFTAVAYANDIVVNQHISYALLGQPLYYQYNPDFFGFFALTAVVSILLKISPFTLIKFGGPLLLAVNVLCIFALARKMKLNRIFSVFAPFFFYTTPLIVYRFNMTIRENLILANYVLIVLLLGEAMESIHRKKFVQRRVFASALLLGAAINSHQTWIMVPFILLLQVFWGVLSHIPKEELRKLFKLAVSFMALSFLFGLLSLPAIINTLRVYSIYRGAIPYYIFRPESFHDFSYWLNVPVLLLSILGIVVFFGTKSRKSKSLIFLFIWFLLALFLTQAPIFGIGMPGRRFLTYLSLPVSIFSALGLCNIISKFRREMSSDERFFSIKRELVHRILIRIVLPLLLVSSVTTYSFFSAYLFPGFLPWQPEDIEAATRLSDLGISNPGPVITYDLRLIQFCNVSNYEPDLFIVS